MCLSLLPACRDNVTRCSKSLSSALPTLRECIPSHGEPEEPSLLQAAFARDFVTTRRKVQKTSEIRKQRPGAMVP